MKLTPRRNVQDYPAGEAPLELRPPSHELRWLFVVVCTALLALLLVSGVMAARLLAELREKESTATHLLSQRAHALTGLWLSVQNYNQAVEQYVAETSTAPGPAANRQLDRLAVEIDSDLRRYPSGRDPAELALFNELQGVFVRQRTIYIAVLSAPPEERRRTQAQFARQLAPVQKQILEWSGKMRDWNRDRLEYSDQAMVTEFNSLQSRLRRALELSLASGVLLALAGMGYIVRLERQNQRRYAQLAQSRQDLQQLSSRLVDAQETERRSISRELHDEVGQALGVLLIDLGRLSTHLAAATPEIKEQVSNMKSVAERTMKAVRDISLLLRPSMIDDLGLIAALEWQGREVSRHGSMEVDVQSEGVCDDLPDDYRICIYRLVQEALRNAARHAEAKAAVVRIEQSAQGIVVRIKDDGKGFDPQRTRGMGMLGMEERVKRLAGTLRVEASPGHGAVVTAELPLPPVNGATT